MLDRFAHPPFGAIARYRLADFFSRDETETTLAHSVCAGSQDDQRVGVRLAVVPDALKIVAAQTE